MSYQVKAALVPEFTNALGGESLERLRNQSPARQKTARFPQPQVLPERVLKSFNTRAFKREQPDSPDLLLRVIAEAIAQNKPIPFVLYWGKGLRSNLGEPEIKCLDYLAALADRVREVYKPGAAITVVFTDTHAELNGHTDQSIREYFAALSVGAHQRGFEVDLLSKLVRAFGEGGEADFLDEPVPEELLSTLCVSAAKWFRGDGTVEQGAIRYYQMNMVEKRVIERAFPRTIFMTFNGSELRSLFPSNLPIFYMFSLRHGICAKPWFLPPDFLSRNAPSNLHSLELAR